MLSSVNTAPVTDDRTAARQLALFSFLLGAAVLFHQSKLGDWEVFSHHAVVTLAAIWLMLRPSSLRRLVILLAVHLVSVVIDLPLVVNHWLLIAIASTGLFIALGVGRLRGAAWAREPGPMYRALAPYLRVQVVLVYAFAALAKMNSAFFEADISCGALMLGDMLDRAPVGLHADWQDPLAIWGTILIEAALPIILALRATRLPAVFIGGGFHLTLALAGHLPFSGFAMAFYSLFIPDDTPERFDRLRAERPWLDRAVRRVQELARSPLAFPVAAGAFLGVAAWITYGPSGETVRSAAVRGFLAIFVVYALALGAVLAACVLQGGQVRYRPGLLRLAHPVWLIGPLLVIANALNPYLGLKTQSTFTMYSNLQTEAGHWNHSIVPEDVRVFDYQDNLVTIVDSSDEKLRLAAENHRDYVWFALRDWADDHPDESVTYVRDGVSHVAVRAGDDPLLSDEPSPILAKVFLFRDVPTDEGNECRIRRNARSDQGS